MMKKLTLILLLFFATTSFLDAQTNINVTFQVDLNHITDMYEGGAVWVYMDAGWNEYYTMADENEDGIYTFTLQKESGSTLTYRYSYQTGPDEWSDYVEENVPNDCSNDDGFREMIVPEADVTLDLVAYGSCDENVVSTITITFQVDMSDEENPNDVQVVIKNPWIWTALTDQGDGIWSGTVEVDANNTYPYTFVNGGQDNWDGEESVPDECNFGTPSAPERHVTVEGEDVVLDLVAFGGCGSVVAPTVNITFQVDMSQEDNPNDVQVVIKNPWIWTALTDQGNDVWSGTVEVNANSTYPYTFVNGGQDNWDEEESVPDECNSGTPSAPERQVTVEEEDVVLDLVTFGSCTLVSSVNEQQVLQLSVFPNPAREHVYITDSPDLIKSVEIFNISGQLISAAFFEQVPGAKINVQNIGKGIYIIRVQTDSGTFNSKLVIE
jgi:hypothetical protein